MEEILDNNKLMKKFRKYKLNNQSILDFGGIYFKKNKIRKKYNYPKITIITVVKNDEKKIQKTIESVLKQKFNNLEYIVIDGNSNDKTLKIIKKFNNKIHIWISKKDKNLWDAMNTGILLSKGDIIGILNSGDYFYKNAIKTVSNYFKNHKIDFLFGAVKKTRVFHRFEPQKIYYRLNIYPAHSCGFFIKRKAQKKVGLYDSSFKHSSDLDLIYRMIVKKKLKGLPTKKNEVLGSFDVQGLSSKEPFYKMYFYEMLVRYKNGQNFLYLIFLFILKIINKLKNVLFFK